MELVLRRSDAYTGLDKLPSEGIRGSMEFSAYTHEIWRDWMTILT